MTLTEEEQRLVAEGRGKDPARLALSLRASDTVRPSVVAGQVDAYNRLKVKVPTWAEKDGLVFPFHVAIQQCSSEPVARFRATLAEGETMIDLTGGLGVDCYFMGRERKSVTYVDASPDAVEAARHNYSILGAENTSFVCTTAEEYVANMVAQGTKVDMIFIDPSRRSSAGERVFRLVDCAPDVTTLGPEMLKVAKSVLIKLSPLVDITLLTTELSHVTDIYAIGAATECKDIVVRLCNEADADAEPRIHAVTLLDDGTPASHIEFTQSQERETQADIAMGIPDVGDHLFVPSPAAMKAAPFALISKTFGVEMLSRATHIYTSRDDSPDFPGRRFTIAGVYDLSKRSLAELRKKTSEAAIAVRNFPLTAEALRKKTGLKESSRTFLFGASTSDGHNRLILCTKTETK